MRTICNYHFHTLDQREVQCYKSDVTVAQLATLMEVVGTLGSATSSVTCNSCNTVVHKRTSILTFEGLSTTFEASTNVYFTFVIKLNVIMVI